MGRPVGHDSDEHFGNLPGRTLANLPVDVSLGKMLIMGTLFHQIDSVMALAAALSVQSPFTNDAFRNSDCVAARKNLDSDHGDPITLLNAYREWLQVDMGARTNIFLLHTHSIFSLLEGYNI